jgi:hypothetical protein
VLVSAWQDAEMEDEPTTTGLREEQARRVAREAREADEAAREGAAEAEIRAHERRADKAAYLRDRLAEAERSERDTTDQH